MVWVIILVVLLAAFGPILWVMPSKRDRQLAALREQARRRGLLVEITQIPKLHATAEERVSAGGKVREPMVTTSAYRLPLRDRAEFAPSWVLLKDAECLDGPIPGWRKHPGVELRRLPEDREYWGEVAAIVAGLEDDCDALEANATNVGWYWQERLKQRPGDELVEALCARLERLYDLQAATDAAQRAASEDQEPP